MESGITRLSSSKQRQFNQSKLVDDVSGGGVQTQESLNVNTLLDPPIERKVDLSRQKYLNCFYTNATSMNNKFDELINEIHANKSQVIMVCETWWTDQSATNIVGFNLFRKDREFSRGGGVCICCTGT